MRKITLLPGISVGTLFVTSLLAYSSIERAGGDVVLAARSAKVAFSYFFIPALLASVSFAIPIAIHESRPLKLGLLASSVGYLLFAVLSYAASSASSFPEAITLMRLGLLLLWLGVAILTASLVLNTNQKALRDKVGILLLALSLIPGITILFTLSLQAIGLLIVLPRTVKNS